MTRIWGILQFIQNLIALVCASFGPKPKPGEGAQTTAEVLDGQADEAREDNAEARSEAKKQTESGKGKSLEEMQGEKDY